MGETDKQNKKEREMNEAEKLKNKGQATDEADKPKKEDTKPDNETEEQSEVKKSIDDFGTIKNAFDFRSNIQYLTIIGSIEGHTVLPPQDKTTKYENIIPQLVAVEENPEIKGLLTILNTVGGDVEAGLAIAELTATLTKPTVSLVLGGGHSIGIPLATASRYSFIAESATMTMHPIRLSGLVIGAEQTYEYFRKMQDRVVDFIVRTSKADRETVLSYMNATGNIANDVGTILFSKDAIDIGLIDEAGGLAAALNKLKTMIMEEEGQNKCR